MFWKYKLHVYVGQSFCISCLLLVLKTVVFLCFIAAGDGQTGKGGTFGNFESPEEKREDVPLPHNQLGVSTG